MLKHFICYILALLPQIIVCMNQVCWINGTQCSSVVSAVSEAAKMLKEGFLQHIQPAVSRILEAGRDEKREMFRLQ